LQIKWIVIYNGCHPRTGIGPADMQRFQMTLRTTVVLSLTFLMAVAMLLIGVVILKVSQRDLLRAKAEQGQLLKACLESLLTATLGSGGGSLESLQIGSLLKDFQAGSLGPSGEWDITITDRNGLVVYASTVNGPWAKQRISALERVIRLKVENVSLTSSPDHPWWAFPEKVIFEAPLISRTKVLGAVRLESSLAEVRQSIWRSQKLILLYIVLDLIVLVAFGAYLFSKLVVRPVQQLVQTAERFQEGDRLPELGTGGQNELSTLAQALNRMLERLAENKEELRQHIISLEQTNLELQRAQQEVLMSEKLASVGRLAAGIAHEIGNPLGIILGYLELLGRKDLAAEEHSELFSRMGSEIQRIHQIIRQLLDFSRPTSGERRPASVHELIGETLAVLEHQLRQQNVEVNLDLEALPDTVFVNGDQLKQVFLNLLVNAADAMGATSERAQGGELRISTTVISRGDLGDRVGGKPLRRRTDPPSADYRYLRLTRAMADERWIEIKIVDTGIGIAGEDLERVFDPFFTTKQPGKGTGLGLSVSVQLIEAMGGRMEMSSRLGEGTTVTVLLQLHQNDTEEGTGRRGDVE
jgi:two-component system NtrC family sensor kinase